MSNVMLQLLAVYVSSVVGLFLMFKLDDYQLKYAIQKAYNAQSTSEVLSLYNRQYSIYSLMLGVSFAFTDSSEVPYIRTPSESEAKMLNVWTMVHQPQIQAIWRNSKEFVQGPISIKF